MRSANHDVFLRELYDLAADPTEMTDLAGNRPEKLEELTGLWEAWNEANNAKP